MSSLRSSILALGIAAAVAVPVSAQAVASPSFALAKTTVTIKAEGTDLSGTVTSPKQKCVTDRKVLLYKIKGTRGGGDDKLIASDLASADGSWSTGNTGIEGRFYAKVRKTAVCKGAESATVRAMR